MIWYVGERTKEGARVFTGKGDAPPLEARKFLNERPSQKLWNHSPTGFEWGYGGSGPAQLALAILFDVLLRQGVDRKEAGERAIALHQQFKFAHVASWNRAGFLISSAAVLEWIKARTLEEAAKAIEKVADDTEEKLREP